MEIVRDVIGADRELMIDVNRAWDLKTAIEGARALEPLDVTWLEEPVFPPEDFATLARLRRETGLPIATGENACTAYQFAEMIRAGAADYVQPSVTKVGGISETLAVREAATRAGVRVAQHAPYFGPGYLATLQLQAACAEEEPFEYLYIDREAELFRGMPLPERGRVAIPEGPGLGLDPDPEVIARYRV